MRENERVGVVDELKEEWGCFENESRCCRITERWEKVKRMRVLV